MDLPALPENTVAAFATLCGAIVVMTKTAAAGDSLFTWSCFGCGEGSRDVNWKAHVIPEANGHAGQCRSVPLPSA